MDEDIEGDYAILIACETSLAMVRGMGLLTDEGMVKLREIVNKLRDIESRYPSLANRRNKR
jgi:hypothetical protein